MIRACPAGRNFESDHAIGGWVCVHPIPTPKPEASSAPLTAARGSHRAAALHVPRAASARAKAEARGEADRAGEADRGGLCLAREMTQIHAQVELLPPPKPIRRKATLTASLARSARSRYRSWLMSSDSRSYAHTQT